MMRKVMKSILSILLISTIAMGCVHSVYADSYVSSDSEENKYVSFFKELNIIDPNAECNSVVTTEKFAEIILKYAYKGAGGFTSDVKDYIIKSGIVEEKFFEEENVNGAMAIKAILNVLGYGNILDNDYDYYLINQREKLTSDVKSFNYNSNLTINDLSKILYRALLVNPVKMKMISSVNSANSVSWEKSNNTYIEEIWKVGYVEGVYTSTGIDGSDDENRIFIDGKQYLLSGSKYKYDSLNAKSVRAFYEEKDKTKIICIMDESERDEMFVVYSDDIISVNADKFVFQYTANKQITINIDNVKVIYNNRIIQNPDNSVFDISNGTVTFIDNKGTSGYDYALIDVYSVFVVGNMSENAVYDKYVRNSAIEFDEYDSYNIILDGNKIDYKELKRGDVLNVYISKDRKVVDVYVTRKSVVGSIAALGDYAEINDEKYSISQYFSDNFTIKLAEEYEFYLDKYSTVVYCAGDSSWLYGYLYEVGEDRESPFDEKVLFKILDSNGEFKIYSNAKNLRVNGQVVKEPDISDNTNLLTQKLKTQVTNDASGKLAYFNRDSLVRQVVKYKTNKNDELSYLSFAEIDGDKNDVSVLVPHVYSSSARAIKDGSFFQLFSTGDDSTVFTVPFASDNKFSDSGVLDVVERDRSKEKYYDAFVGNSGSVLPESSFEVIGYDVNEGGKAKCVAVNQSAGGGDPISPIMLLSDIHYGLNEDGAECLILIGLQDGKEVKYKLPEDFEFTDGVEIKIGDVLMVDVFGEEITSLSIRYMLEEHTKGTETISGLYPGVSQYASTEYGAFSGYVYSYNDEGIILADDYKNPTKLTSYTFNSLKYVYYYDEGLRDEKGYVGDKKPLLKATKNSPGEPDYVFIRVKYGRMEEMVVYKAE